jgi:hypothetical protein
MLNLPETGHAWTENWLFKLANDNATFLYLSLSDVTYSSNFYEGAIINKPSIRESINLSNSTAKTGNISIQIADYNYNGSPISEELFGGSYHYINQTVTVHSKINAETPIQIGTFRLTDISSDGDKISLSLASHRPWDFISVPNKVTKEGTYYPIAYGDFQYETSGVGSEQFCDDAKCFPVPVNEIKGDDIYCLLPFGTGFGDGDSDPSFETLHYYDSNLDIFIPLYPQNNSSVDYQDGEAITAPTDLKRAFKWNDAVEGNGNEWSNYHSLTDSTQYTSAGVSSTYPTTSDEKSLFIDVQQPSGYFSSLSIYIEWKIVISSLSGGSPAVRLQMITPTATTIAQESVVDTYIGSGTIDIQADSNGTIPQIEFKAQSLSNASGESASGTCYIRAFYIAGTAELNENEPDNLNKTLSDLKQLYSAPNSMPKSWTTGEATEIHEAHRDILIRYTGMTTDTPTGWSALDTARNGWNLRWWQLKPVELEKTLNKLAYEGGFIFRFKSDGSPQYIVIPSSPSTDKTLSKNDIKGFTVKPSSMSELLTKSEIEFNKHPSDEKYRDFYSWANSTARTNWNIQAKENIANIRLDALISNENHTTYSSELDEDLDSSETQITVNTGGNFSINDIIRIDDEEMLITNIVSSFLTVTRGYRKTDAVTHEDGSDILVLDFSPISDFTNYYDNIFGDIKLIVSGTIVNPEFYNLEVGDIVDFSDMHPTKAYGEAWTGKNFMITSIGRTIGTLKFEGREI